MAASVAALPTSVSNNNSGQQPMDEQCSDASTDLSIAIKMETPDASETPESIITISGSFPDPDAVSHSVCCFPCSRALEQLSRCLNSVGHLSCLPSLFVESGGSPFCWTSQWHLSTGSPVTQPGTLECPHPAGCPRRAGHCFSSV